MRRHAHVCQRQVERLRTSLGAMQGGVDVNNRVPQPLHGRAVVRVTPPDGVGEGAQGGSGRGDCPECASWQWLLLAAAIVGLFVLRVRVIGCVRSTHQGRQLLPTSSTGSSPRGSPPQSRVLT